MTERDKNTIFTYVFNVSYGKHLEFWENKTTLYLWWKFLNLLQNSNKQGKAVPGWILVVK